MVCQRRSRRDFEAKEAVIGDRDSARALRGRQRRNQVEQGADAINKKLNASAAQFTLTGNFECDGDGQIRHNDGGGDDRGKRTEQCLVHDYLPPSNSMYALQSYSNTRTFGSVRR